MTADRAKALALFEEIFQKAMFHSKDAKDLYGRFKDIEKDFEFEGTIEKSNEVTPDTNVTSMSEKKPETLAEMKKESSNLNLDDLPF
jgi:RecA-family ATPase